MSRKQLSAILFITGICLSLAATCPTLADLTNCQDCAVSTIANATVNSSCISCSSGFYLPNPGQCQACPENCDVCSTGVCLICKEGSFLMGGKCIACSEGEPETIDGKLYKGIPNCITCQSPKDASTMPVCMSCEPGFYVTENNTCSPCILSPENPVPVTGCVQCGTDGPLTNGTKVCITCGEGKHIHTKDTDAPYCSTNGHSNPDNCLRSSVPDRCDVCRAGWYPGNASNETQKPCEPCPDGCTTCLAPNSTHPTPICTTCADNYWLHPKPGSQHCHYCGDNCTTCIDKATCAVCNVGFYQTSDLTCSSCSSKLGDACLTCSPKGDLCLSCKEDNILTPDGKCVPGKPTDNNCWISKDPSTCLQCKIGTEMGDKKTCQPCANCQGDECNKCGAVSTFLGDGPN